MNKIGVSPLVSGVIIMVVVMASTFLVMNTLTPVLEKGKETSILNNGKQVLSALDTAIRELIYEAPGAKKELKLTTTGGRFIVSGKDDKIQFSLLTSTPILEPGSSTKEGNMLISYGPNLKASEYDANSDGEIDLVIENDAVLFAVRKLYSSTNIGFINTTNVTHPFITLIRNKRTGTDITPTFGIFINDDVSSSYGNGYTQLVETGETLSEANIKLYLESNANITYETYFTLLSGQDFVKVSVKVI